MKKSFVVVLLLLFSSVLTLAQQPYVGKWDAFTGFSYLTTPSMNLVQRGFNSEFGYNHRRWVALGVDVSYFNGHSSLGSDPLSLGVKAKLAPLMGMLPAGTVVAVPFDSSTFTMSMGPQFNIRKIKQVTFFVRPALGWLHVNITAKPNSALTTGVVQQLLGASKTSITDDVVFYGFGGGVDLNLTKHMAIRMSTDFIHLNMFSDLLADNRNTVRMSVGPTFRFGKNVE
jgi:hypothetical protein